jgi:hypothetical protein
MPGPYCKSRFFHFVLWSKVRRDGAVRGQARWQVDGVKPMIWWFITLSYTPHHNILRAWGIVVTTLDSIKLLLGVQGTLSSFIHFVKLKPKTVKKLLKLSMEAYVATRRF